MLSVSNSYDYNENSIKGKNCLQTNARPSGPTPTNPRPGQKLGCKGPGVRANFRYKPPWVRGGIVMAKIDSCISLLSDCPLGAIKLFHNTLQRRRCAAIFKVICSKQLKKDRSNAQTIVIHSNKTGVYFLQLIKTVKSAFTSYGRVSIQTVRIMKNQKEKLLIKQRD